MRQDAALEEGVELVLDEPRQLGVRAGLGVGDDGLHFTVDHHGELLQATFVEVAKSVVADGLARRHRPQQAAFRVVLINGLSHGMRQTVGVFNVLNVLL
jgi:hypothetical protein